MAAACDGGAGTPAAPAPTPATAQGRTRAVTCLPQVWAYQQRPDEAFDLAHDRAEGGSFSCATGTSAGAYAQALRAIRGAAARRDTAALVRHSAARLLVIDRAGARRDLPGEQAQGDPGAVFTPALVAMLSRAELADITVASDGGGFLALGAVWLAPAGPGQVPRIVTVNLQALAEAEAAGAIPAR